MNEADKSAFCSSRIRRELVGLAPLVRGRCHVRWGVSSLSSRRRNITPTERKTLVSLYLQSLGIRQLSVLIAFLVCLCATG